MIAGASRIVSALDVVPGGVIPKSSRAKSSSGSLWRALRFTPSRAALAATLVIAAVDRVDAAPRHADQVRPDDARERACADRVRESGAGRAGREEARARRSKARRRPPKPISLRRGAAKSLIRELK